RDLLAALRARLPASEVLQVRFGDFLAVVVAQRGLENDAQTAGEARDFSETCFLERGQRVELAGFAAVLELLQGIEEIVTHVWVLLGCRPAIPKRSRRMCSWRTGRRKAESGFSAVLAGE